MNASELRIQRNQTYVVIVILSWYILFSRARFAIQVSRLWES
jgi:hypothetical protein